MMLVEAPATISHGGFASVEVGRRGYKLNFSVK